MTAMKATKEYTCCFCREKIFKGDMCVELSMMITSNGKIEHAERVECMGCQFLARVHRRFSITVKPFKEELWMLLEKEDANTRSMLAHYNMTRDVAEPQTV